MVGYWKRANFKIVYENGSFKLCTRCSQYLIYKFEILWAVNFTLILIDSSFVIFQYLDDELDSIDDVEKYEKAHNFKVMNSKL